MNKTIKLKDVDPMLFAGTSDSNLNFIEKKFDAKIILRGDEIHLDGNESELSRSSLRIYAEAGSTRKNISIPVTLWVIDNKADNGSWILNKLM